MSDQPQSFDALIAGKTLAESVSRPKPLPEGDYIVALEGWEDKSFTYKTGEREGQTGHMRNLKFAVKAAGEVDQSKLPENYTNYKVFHTVFFPMGRIEDQLFRALGVQE